MIKVITKEDIKVQSFERNQCFRFPVASEGDIMFYKFD